MFLLGDFCFCRSFAETCTRLQSALQSKMFAGSEKDVLVPLLFNSVKVIYSVRPLEIFICFTFEFCCVVLVSVDYVVTDLLCLCCRCSALWNI